MSRYSEATFATTLPPNARRYNPNTEKPAWVTGIRPTSRADVKKRLADVPDGPTKHPDAISSTSKQGKVLVEWAKSGDGMKMMQAATSLRTVAEDIVNGDVTIASSLVEEGVLEAFLCLIRSPDRITCRSAMQTFRAFVESEELFNAMDPAMLRRILVDGVDLVEGDSSDPVAREAARTCKATILERKPAIRVVEGSRSLSVMATDEGGAGIFANREQNLLKQSELHRRRAQIQAQAQRRQRIDTKRAKEVLEIVKKKLWERGVKGCAAVGRLFRIMDDDGSKQLSREEFVNGMRDCGLRLPEEDYNTLFEYFDEDGSGTLSVDELIVGVLGNLNERRQELVRRAFRVLDVTQDGEITIEDIRKKYNARQSADVLAGKCTEEEVLLQVLTNFESRGNADGRVSLEEFEDYYASVSANIDNDDYFALMMQKSWNVR
eukprot:Rmarinus@m.12362